MSHPLVCPTVKLNDGHSMPLVALGTFQGNYDYSASTTVVMESVKSAIDIGYRHMDTAYLYNTEKFLGQAIKDKITEGVVSREDMFVTTKLWSTYHRRHLVVDGAKASLAQLGFDYVDLLLIHWPMAMPPGEYDNGIPRDEDGVVIFEDDTSFIDTWKGMEDCKKMGLARSIGVSNFNRKQLQRIIDSCEIMPAVNQIEVHIHHANFAMAKFCKEHNIIMTAFSPVGKPARPWKKDSDPSIFTNPTVTKIAEKYKKTNPQIALRYLTQLGHAVAPKSNSPERQRENIDIFNFTLSEDDMEILKKENKDFRVLFLEHLGHAKEYPFTDWEY